MDQMNDATMLTVKTMVSFRRRLTRDQAKAVTMNSVG